MQKRVLVRASLAVALSGLLASGVVGCKKKSATENATSTGAPETVRPEVEEPSAPKVFAIGDDFNRVEVEPHVTPPSVADAQASLVTGAWSTFRGNDARTGLRDVPAIENPKIQWRTEIGIIGYSNVIAERDGRLYVSTQGQSHDQSDEWDGVVALDAESGKVLWRYRTESDANGMTLYDDALYVVTSDGHVHAIAVEDGSQRWNRDLGCSMRTAPTVVGDYVHILRNGKVTRLFRENGTSEMELERCSSLDRGGLSYDGGTMATVSMQDRVRLFEGTERVWTSTPRGDKSDYSGAWTPGLLLDGLLVTQVSTWPYPRGTQDFRGDDEFDYRAAVVAYWRDNGERAWVTDIDGEDPERKYRANNIHNHALPLVVAGKVFAPTLFRSELSVLDLATGARVGGVKLPDCRARQFSSPVGTLTAGYYARHDGVLYQFDYETLAVNWSLALGKAGLSGQSTTHEAVRDADSCSVVPVDGTALFGTPSIGVDGTVYVGSGEGWIYAIKDAAR